MNALLGATIVKGNSIEFEFDSFNRIVSNLKFVGESYLNPAAGGKKEWKKPQKQNDDMNNLDSLLKSAHEKGLISINTEIISIDFEKKIAVFKATVRGIVKKKVVRINLSDKVEQEEIIEQEIIGTFTGTGDAVAEDLKGEIAKSWIRMAETRAICRALRWYTNNAEVSQEEIPEVSQEKVSEIQNSPIVKRLVDYLQINKEHKVAIDNLPGILKADEKEVRTKIKDLLEEGTIYEPIPGYVQYL